MSTQLEEDMAHLRLFCPGLWEKEAKAAFLGGLLEQVAVDKNSWCEPWYTQALVLTWVTFLLFILAGLGW